MRFKMDVFEKLVALSDGIQDFTFGNNKDR